MTARHAMILASAGSGKTYALTHRFVALLAEGAPPERIAALTFTRKAAGEFFDEILNKLARAATEDDFAARLAADVGRPALGAADFRQMLRATIAAMPRLRLGTLDGFFARIARSFPMELGLAGEFEVLREHAARRERRRVLARLFARAPGGLDEAQREFIEAFKRATFGLEEKRLAARLDTFLDEHQEIFLSAPSPALWGDPARIWPEGCEWLAPTERALPHSVAALGKLLRSRQDLAEKQVARFEAFFAALPEWTAGAPLPAPVEYLLKNALIVWDDLRRGAAELTVDRRKVALGPPECEELTNIVRHLVRSEYTRRLEITRGIHAVLRGYDSIYHEAVRRSGRLTFGDVLRLLQPESSGRTLAGGDDAGEGRLLIDYRLDGRFDHWLLDEFQDTSFTQWNALRNLIDEAVQDPTGRRSFFCVGDVKQAIYTWRGGDPGLFREVQRHYTHAAPGSIEERHLTASWRSAPPIIDMVNAVFGCADRLATLFPGAASDTWNREWRTHESARPGLAGHAAWLHAGDEAERFALTARLLREIDPLARGLDCAVLTRTNATAAALADHIRREAGMPAVAESDLRVATDNPVGVALLALVKAAAHPGDTLAHEHVAMSPLGGLLRNEGILTPDRLTARLLGQIHAEGFERTLAHWWRRIEETLPPQDTFNRLRGRQFLAAAAQFDATGERSVTDFLDFMERHAAPDAEVAGVIKVMTIHKSKGLGFDVVLLPDLEGQRIDQRRDGLAVQQAEDRSVRWILDLPPKLFCAQDETLSAHVREAEAEACHEALALLYVAMTRAKRTMYAITSPPSSSESRNYPKILTETLGGASNAVRIAGLTTDGGWESGDPSWLDVSRPEPSRPVVGPPGDLALDVAMTTRATRRPAARPSEAKIGSVGAREILSGAKAAVFGDEVHRLLASIEWGETADTAPWEASGFSAEAIAEALGCLTGERLHRVWARPQHGEVWRERTFEIVLDDAWVTGVFDRVVLERGADGRTRRLTVYDFKTERLSGGADPAQAARRHASQMNLYRRAAAVLAGVPLTEVACVIVLTQRRELVPITGE